MTRSYIWIKGRKYYYQGTFDTYEACWNANPDKVMLRMGSMYRTATIYYWADIACYNGTTWQTIATTYANTDATGSAIWETAINWNTHHKLEIEEAKEMKKGNETEKMKTIKETKASVSMTIEAQLLELERMMKIKEKYEKKGSI